MWQFETGGDNGLGQRQIEDVGKNISKLLGAVSDNSAMDSIRPPSFPSVDRADYTSPVSPGQRAAPSSGPCV